MDHLEDKIFYTNGMACHFLRTPAALEPLIIAIPGGPGLSGNYLAPFLFNLANLNDINVGLLDLPNHGDSVIPDEHFPLNYQKSLHLIVETLNEISKENNDLILFGQSLGARFAFDCLSKNTSDIRGAFLTGLPYEFCISTELEEKINTMEASTITDPEIRFMEVWKNILPFYTYSPLPKNIFNSLAKNTKLIGNENMLEDVPNIESVANKLYKNKNVPPIAILECLHDKVVPNNNWEKLRFLIPHAKFTSIDNCGHFVMVEHPEVTHQAFTNFYTSLTK